MSTRTVLVVLLGLYVINVVYNVSRGHDPLLGSLELVALFAALIGIRIAIAVGFKR